MMDGVKRWSASLLALLAGGPIVYALTATGSPTGAFRVPGLLSARPVTGLGRDVLALALAAAIGLVAGRLVSLRTGLFATGLALAWGAWGGGSIDSVTRAAGASGGAGVARALVMLSVEGAVLGLLAAAAAWAMARYARPSGLRPVDRTGPTLAQLGLALVAGVAALTVLAWVVAQNARPGQALAAGVIGAIGATAAGLFVQHRVSPAVAVAAAGVMAALGPLAAGALAGFDGARLAGQVFAGSIFPTGRLLPMHWLAGAFLGVPLGISLGQWLVSHKFHPPHHPVHHPSGPATTARG